jgi:hypothetical protein
MFIDTLIRYYLGCDTSNMEEIEWATRFKQVMEIRKMEAKAKGF